MFISLFPALSTALTITHPTYSAVQPREPQKLLEKRDSNTSHTVGIGIGISVILVFVLVITFYLGRRRERFGSWYCWKAAQSNLDLEPKKLSELEGAGEPCRLKSRISCPVALSSSAPVELHGPTIPVEAALRPQFLELPTKEIYEMGLPTPCPSPRRASWVNRATCWNRYSGHRKESKAKGQKSQYEMEWITNPPAYPDAVRMRTWHDRDGSKDRASTGSVLIDWRSSGLEYVRKVYV